MPILETIVLLCQIHSSAPAKEVERTQTACQAYYLECVEKSHYKFDETGNLKACVIQKAQEAKSSP